MFQIALSVDGTLVTWYDVARTSALCQVTAFVALLAMNAKYKKPVRIKVYSLHQVLDEVGAA